MIGRTSLRLSIRVFKSLYAFHSFKSLGRRRHWSAYLFADSSIAIKSSLLTSVHDFSLKLFISLITVS